MAKVNCWEASHCGRQPGGAKSRELGVCPAATEMRVNGINGGMRGGRACWALAGTMCGGVVQGTYASRFVTCQSCDFYARVKAEEGASFVAASTILACLC